MKNVFKQVNYLTMLDDIMSQNFVDDKLNKMLDLLEQRDPRKAISYQPTPKDNSKALNCQSEDQNQEGSLLGKRARSLRHLYSENEDL